jgi:serine/threonine-protein kinase
MMSKINMSVGAEDDSLPSSAEIPESHKATVAQDLPQFGRTEATTYSEQLKVVPPVEGSSIFTETDRFVAREWLGEGGMGTVIRAFDKDLERDVAIKVQGPRAAGSVTALERFSEEARITGQLEHPFIVPVYEFGTDQQGARFLCMKLVEGSTLEETLRDDGLARLKPARLTDLLQIFVKVCDAVSFAHSRGVTHRDLKPSNVMTGKFGQVYVMDWGLAQARGPAPAGSISGTGKLPEELPGTLVGTPCYMAPEQLLGQHDRIDERTDVFLLGALLYEVLTGRPPRTLDEVQAIVAGKIGSSIVHPDQIVEGASVPAELSRIALKAMAPASEDRYASVNDLKSDIERFQRGAWHLPNQRFAKGSLIVAEGELGDTAYIIAEGRCSVFRNGSDGEVVLRELGPGEVFGETAVFSNKPRTAGVRAMTDVVVLGVTTEVLSNALGLNQWMGSFVRALAERFREVDERLRRYDEEQRMQQAKA